MGCMDEQRLQRIQRFSRTLRNGTWEPFKPSDVFPSEVIVSMPMQACRHVWEHLKTKDHVHLIAEGVTLPQEVPPWMFEKEHVVLTETGAFRDEYRHTSSAARMKEMQDWLSKNLTPVLGVDASQVLYGSAFARLVRKGLYAEPFMKYLNDWVLGKHVKWIQPPGNEQSVQSKTNATKQALLLAKWAGYWNAEVALQIKQWLQYTLFYKGKAQERLTDPPGVFLLLHARWERMNRHVLHSLVRPLMKKEQASLGILLFGGLAPGAPDETNMSVSRGSEVWAGLSGACKEWLVKKPMFQVCMPENPGAMKGLLFDLQTVFWKIRNLVSSPPDFVEDMDRYLRFLSIDMVRTVFVKHATSEWLKTYPKTKTLFMTTASLLETACVEWMARDRGIHTIDAVHGSSGDGWVGDMETFSNTRLVWTASDKEVMQAHRKQHIEIAGMPDPGFSQAFQKDQEHLARMKQKLRSDTPLNLLFCAAYTHRDWSYTGFYLRPFQRELMRMGSLLKATGRWNVRYRPHPADHKDWVREDAAPWNIPLSVDALAEDVAWSDVMVIQASSSVFLESLCSGRLLFAHMIPEFEAGIYTKYFDERRRFCYAEEGVQMLGNVYQDLQDNADIHDAEQSMRKRFFPQGHQSIEEYMRPYVRLEKPIE